MNEGDGGSEEDGQRHIGRYSITINEHDQTYRPDFVIDKQYSFHRVNLKNITESVVLVKIDADVPFLSTF